VEKLQVCVLGKETTTGNVLLTRNLCQEVFGWRSLSYLLVGAKQRSFVLHQRDLDRRVRGEVSIDTG